MLSMAGGKGGVGRTTCALAFGAALGRDGREALVVGTDARGPDLRRTAGIDARPDTADPTGLWAVADGVAATVAARSVPGRPGLSILPRDCGPGRRPERRALDRLDWPGPVVLDAPAGAGRAVARPLRAADHAVLVATPAPAALRSAARSAAICGALGTPTVGTILTRCSESFDLEPLLDCPTIAAVPPTDRPLADGAVAATFDRLVARIG